MAKLNVENIEGLASDSTINIAAGDNLVIDSELQLAQSTFRVPAGNLAGRIASPSQGSVRYNTNANGLEVYSQDETNWSYNLTGTNTNLVDLGEGSGGGGGGGTISEIQNIRNLHASYALPVTSGLVGWYDVASYSESTGVWADKSGNNNDTSSYRGAQPPQVVLYGSKGKDKFGAARIWEAITGDTSQGLIFPEAILPTTYTLFHITRYAGSSYGRIMDGYTSNWLSGFWSGGSGKGYHDGWLTDSGHNLYDRCWVLTMDQNDRIRFNKGNYEVTGGGGTHKRLTINAGNYTNDSGSEQSDWACAEVIVYNRTLTSNEYADVENYLDTKYQFTYF